MYLLRQTFLGFLITWIVYAVVMGFLEIEIFDRVIRYLDSLNILHYSVVVVSGTLSGFLTVLFTKKKEWSSNTIAGTIIAMGAALFVLFTTKEAYGLEHIFWILSLAAVHTGCFSLTGFLVQKRRLNKLKEYNITDQRIDSFGEKSTEAN